MNFLGSKNVIFGGVYTLIGFLSYFVWSDGESVTALIPAFFGIPLIGLSFLSHFQKRIVSLFSFLLNIFLLAGTIPGILKFFPLVFGGVEFARPLAIKVQTFTGLIAIIYLIFTFFSFRNKKR